MCVIYIYIYIHIAPFPLSKPHRPRGPRRNHLKALPRTRSCSSLVFVELGPKISAYHAKKYWWILPINPYKRSLKGDTRYKMVDVSWCVTGRSWRLWGPHSQLFPATSPSCNPMYPICVGEKRWAQGRWLGLVCVCLKRYSVSTSKARCSIEVVSGAFGMFPVNFRTKCLFWHVHVHFDFAGSRKTGVAGLANGTFPVNFHTKWLLGNVRVPFDRAGSHKVCFSVLANGTFPVNFYTKWLLWNVRVPFDRAGSHKVCFPVLGSVFLLNILLLNIIIFLLNIHIIIFLSSSSPSSPSSSSPSPSS